MSAICKFFEIKGPSKHIFHLDHTKRFEGAAINFVSFGISWSNRKAFVISSPAIFLFLSLYDNNQSLNKGSIKTNVADRY